MLLAITYRAVAELKPYPRNARTHSRKQVKQIAAAIKEFGFTNPVLIDEHDQIIAGHGRVAAARLLGLLQVPTLQLSHLSPRAEAGLYSGRQSAGREGRLGQGNPRCRIAGTARRRFRGYSYRF